MQDTALLEQLADDIGSARQLLELTDREFQALTDRDLSGLEKLLTSKQPLLALLSQHGAARSQILKDQQLNADRSGLEAFAASAPNGPEILRLADELDEILHACREANERNGRLIQASQSVVGGMLNILQGTNKTPDLYDRRGGTAKTSLQRPLSQA